VTRAPGAVVERFDPLTDVDALQAWVDCALASARHVFGDRHTAWSALELREEVRLDDTCEELFFLARRGDATAGAGRVVLSLRDNKHLADLELDVHPRHRRAGVGSALLGTMERATHDRGRTSIRVESTARLGQPDPAEPFASRHGYRSAQVDLRSDLDLPVDLDELLVPLEHEAARFSADYDVLTWWDDVPEVWRAERARCAVAMSTDAPSGEVDLEAEDWDAGRVTRMLETLHAQGRRFLETVAVHRPTGHVVAFTDLVVPRHAPDMALQWDTLVVGEHRGQRLGQLVKAANLRALRRELPDVAWLCTWNAESNEPMLRVNRAMGFRPVGRTTEWLKQAAASAG
jgi:GNAT superfamily N-acetyltransferase